jgi:hypothetical protein
MFASTRNVYWDTRTNADSGTHEGILITICGLIPISTESSLQWHNSLRRLDEIRRFLCHGNDHGARMA